MANIWRQADIQPMLDEWGVSVTVGSVTARCIVSDNDEQIAATANSVLVGRAITLRTVPGTFPALVEGVTVTVDYPAPATAYKAVAVRRVSTEHESVICARV